ncbi:hypothetical protein [Leptospira ilyithenensis]|uniref:Uncharacterized protein n=1 Tax=Leptospira ilyithenensis TaxID=2484901 RepID=A0A4R9LLJ4_9LEPT|nr:hypothetical protein [Leptospira ilyithenensis]TGN07024.1 hypothetical protein EHS11_18030 [Leptospira ilyithenensis]
MNKVSKAFGLIFVLAFETIGCMYSIHQFHAGDTEKPAKIESVKKIVAEAEQFTILGIVKNTSYADEALHKLVAQCPNGMIQSIGSRFSTDLGFLSWTNRIRLEGYCVVAQ